MKELVIKFNISVDNLDEQITLFQIAFLKEVYYHSTINGEFRFIKSFFCEKYHEILDCEGIMIEINDLIERGYVIKKNKRTIYNAKFTTYVIYIITDKFLDSILIPSSKHEKM